MLRPAARVGRCSAASWAGPPPPPLVGIGGENLLFGFQVKGTVDTCREVLLKALQSSTGPFPVLGSLFYKQLLRTHFIPLFWRGSNQNQRWEIITQALHNTMENLLPNNYQSCRDPGGQALHLARLRVTHSPCLSTLITLLLLLLRLQCFRWSDLLQPGHLGAS